MVKMYVCKSRLRRVNVMKAAVMMTKTVNSRGRNVAIVIVCRPTSKMRTANREIGGKTFTRIKVVGPWQEEAPNTIRRSRELIRSETKQNHRVDCFGLVFA
jgi:hypothetical protein